MNVKGFKDSTPLHEAVLNDHIECIKYLLEKGADITIRNSHGFLAKDFLKNQELIKLFEKYEVNKHAFNASKIDSLDTTVNKTTNNSISNRKRNSKQKTITIFATSMNEEEKLRLSEFSKKLNFKFVREMTSNGMHETYLDVFTCFVFKLKLFIVKVTHVVYKDTNNDNTCQRTINYMKAVLNGLWILSLKCKKNQNKLSLFTMNSYLCSII